MTDGWLCLLPVFVIVEALDELSSILAALQEPIGWMIDPHDR